MSEEQVAVAETAGAAEAVTEAKPVTIGKGKKSASNDLILDIAKEVEGLTKSKALSMAENLAETVESSYFKLGGVLKVIKENTWFEGYQDFDTFVFEKYGFQARKAHYLIQIYTDLVTKQIPWAKVSHLGWTKLKDLSGILTPENVDEWVAKAEKLTVAELQHVLKAKAAPEQGDKAVEEFIPFKLKLKPDQKALVDTAVAKAKGELNTEYDSVALENICAAYLTGTGTATAKVDTSSVEAFCKSVGMMPILETLAAQNPEWDISVDKAKTAAAA